MNSDSAPSEPEAEVTALVNQEEEEGIPSQIRQLPLEIIVKTPDGIHILVSAVNLQEPTSFIRQVLQEYQETAPYTNYDFEIDGALINDFIEIGHYAPTDEAVSSILLVMKPARYDIKKSRLQLKRVRDMICYPPAAKGVIAEIKDGEVREVEQQVAKKEEVPTPTNAYLRSKLPSAEEIFSPATLDTFFYNTMLRCGSGDTSAHTAVKSPLECVKGLSASGWNPPPPSRRVQGDLFYIEAVTEEAVFHITCTPAGFYVNKSTRYTFDPTPTANAHFSHELFITLLGASASLRASWSELCATAPKSQSMRVDTSTGALDVVSDLYAQGRVDQIFRRPQWTVPPTRIETAVNGTGAPLKSLKHSFDLSRLHDDLGDQFGAEEPGAPREW